MASRSLTELFFMMRNNATQSRLIYENLNPSLRSEKIGTLPITTAVTPKWMEELDKIQSEIHKLKEQIEFLKELQHKNLYRPSLDDISSDENKIQDLTHEITSILSNIHRVVQFIKNEQQIGSIKERRLKQNVVRTLVLTLQEHTIVFRGLQNTYLTKIQAREQRLNFFDISNVSSQQKPNEIDNKFITKPKIENIPMDIPNIGLNQSRRESIASTFSMDKIHFNKDDCKLS